MDNISEADKVLIEKYVLGQPLTMDEQAQFNNRSKDTDFETALLWEQDIHVALQVEGRKQLKREFQTLEENLSASNKTVIPLSKKKKNKWYLGIAAAIIGLIIAGLAIFSPFQPNHNELFATYFEPYPNIIAPIAKGEQDILFYEKAFQLYEAGEYQQALTAFDSLYHNETVLFYKGLTLIQLEQYHEAQNILEKLMIEKGEFYQPTQWYLALAYLKTEDLSKAKELLQAIQSNDHPYQKEAKELYGILD